MLLPAAKKLLLDRLRSDILRLDLESFSYSVSHDLRAPLRAVNGYSIMLKEMLGQQADPATGRVIDTILSGTRTMGKLIDDLLQFSRMGRKAMMHMTINMNMLAEECVCELTRNTPGHSSIALDNLPPAYGDPVLLKQVWLNLIGNAIKYSSSVAAPKISIGSIAGKPITYFIKDNGVGFDMAYAHKLLGVFQRLHGQSEFEGTGIGLALVKRIIDRHGGQLWAEAKPGEGATFYFTIPKQKNNDT